MCKIMCVLIGGSGSTGSTLLRKTLNRHPDIFSGGEINFFNKEQLFEDWNKYKNNLLNNKTLCTKGWFPYCGNLLLLKEYGWKYSDLIILIQKSKSIIEFTQEYFSPLLKKNKSKIWIEKTPSNCYSFELFLNTFKNGKVIHTVRNPLDTTSSLCRRGMNTYFAAGLNVYNTASALVSSNSPRYLLVKYENLVRFPEKTVKEILEFIGLDYCSSMFDQCDQDNKDKIGSWGSHPGKEISKKNIGKFKSIESKDQRRIITALTLFEISKKHINNKGLEHKNCIEICDQLGYHFQPNVYNEFRREYRKNFIKDLVSRTLNNYPTSLLNYPAKFKLK